MNAYYSSCRHVPHWWLFRSFLTFCYGEQYHNEHPWKKLHTCPINSSGSFLEGELLGQSACTSKYRNLLLAGCTHERSHWTLWTQERDHFSQGSKLINLGGQRSNTDEFTQASCQSADLWRELNSVHCSGPAPKLSATKAFKENTHIPILFLKM